MAHSTGKLIVSLSFGPSLKWLLLALFLCCLLQCWFFLRSFLGLLSHLGGLRRFLEAVHVCGRLSNLHLQSQSLDWPLGCCWGPLSQCDPDRDHLSSFSFSNSAGFPVLLIGFSSKIESSWCLFLLVLPQPFEHQVLWSLNVLCLWLLHACVTASIPACWTATLTCTFLGTPMTQTLLASSSGSAKMLIGFSCLGWKGLSNASCDTLVGYRRFLLF